MPNTWKKDQQLHSNLEKWRNIGPDLMIVHSIGKEYVQKSEFKKKPAEVVFGFMDVISCSLISLRGLRKAARELDNLSHWESETLNSGLYFELGFVLDIPPQNILGTHSHDVSFPNHIGTAKVGSKHITKPARGESWKLVDSILSGKGKQFGEQNWPSKAGHSYNRIRSPKEILRDTDMSWHNEILVVGKSNINIYQGYKPTSALKVKAIISAKKHYTGHSLFSRAGDDEMRKSLRTLIGQNPNIELIEI